MNERDFRIKLVEAYGGTGGYSNERDFWNSLLTAVYGTPTRALNEREFWIKFSEGVQGTTPPLADDQAIVEDGDQFPATGGTVTINVTNNTVTTEFTPD